MGDLSTQSVHKRKIIFILSNTSQIVVKVKHQRESEFKEEKTENKSQFGQLVEYVKTLKIYAEHKQT